MPGKLYVVPTPIGNLADISMRALSVLAEADVILAEDTRTSGVLLKKYDIIKPILSYHAHNEHKIKDKLIKRLAGGETMALVTDAGTPAISDPGFLLVRACIESDIEVDCLPGATAFVPALVNSGLPCDRFVFEGFLPHKKGRKARMTLLAEEERTLVFYESPHRLVKTLKQLGSFFGHDRRISVSRELTKIYQENVRGEISDVLSHFEGNSVKGEIVMVVEGNKKGNGKS